MGRRRGFTLTELLISMGIMAAMATVFAPAIRSTKSALQQSQALRSCRDLSLATSLYITDSNDMFPPAVYASHEGATQAWFGLEQDDGSYDPMRGLLSLYAPEGIAKDPTHHAVPYLGDGTGFGYNYGFLGSDMHLRGTLDAWPHSENPAHASEIDDSARVLVYATSAFFSAPWLPKGDGKTYDFGFVDPPSGWNGNPNMAFRHFANTAVDEERKQVRAHGKALAAFADGSVRPLLMREVKDEMFWRSLPAQP